MYVTDGFTKCSNYNVLITSYVYFINEYCIIHVFLLPFTGVISANGEAGTSSGGASGGSLWIKTDGFHGSGILQANGGAGRNINTTGNVQEEHRQ